MGCKGEFSNFNRKWALILGPFFLKNGESFWDGGSNIFLTFQIRKVACYFHLEGVTRAVVKGKRNVKLLRSDYWFT